MRVHKQYEIRDSGSSQLLANCQLASFGKKLILEILWNEKVFTIRDGKRVAIAAQ